jgi:Rne/Rng family ribonuclease
VSESETPEGGATGDETRTAPVRSRTRSRTRPKAEPEAAPQEQPAAEAPADAEDKPAVKRTTRRRTVQKDAEGAPSEQAAGDEPAAEEAAPKKAPSRAKPKAKTAPKAADKAEAEAAEKPEKPARPRASTKAKAKVAQDEAPEADEKSAEKPAKAAPKPRAKAAAKPSTKVRKAAEADAEIDPGSEAEAEPQTEAETAAASSGEPGLEVAADAADGEDAADEPEAAEATGSASRRSRRGRRGGRNRNRSRRTDGDGDDVDGEEREQSADADASDEPEASESEAPTRLQARRASGGRGRGRSARRPVPGVSEEVRRTIAEQPPRRMLVTVGAERTQIAVLEERTLVEHYVTRKQDVSYVGNIYLGRVQNVLPGMEAAFVDIGKGRNGVLYAGEVNYDEADLEGELPRIEDRLKAGQSVLVQVTKDPMGTKGARLTQHLSVAGRYCVLAPGEGMLGISRKLPDEERERLRVILKAIRPERYGLIVRTAAEGATREQLEADVARLVRIWEQVEERAEKAKPLEPVYEEPGLVIRVIRDVFGPEYTELIVDSEELATQVRDYLGDVSPELVDRVKVHEPAGEPDGEPESLFDAYEVTNQIRRALEKKVWLKSGGYLIVEKTEAMWVIDVNTGKFVGERNLEATVLKNNIEAAEEIARQLRLRDMGGIIVIDFVDMLVPANRDEVLKRFKRELARDKTKSRVMEISKLGLVQMTRKNVSQGLQESFTTRCEVCEGRGAKIVEKMV